MTKVIITPAVVIDGARKGLGVVILPHLDALARAGADLAARHVGIGALCGRRAGAAAIVRANRLGRVDGVGLSGPAAPAAILDNPRRYIDGPPRATAYLASRHVGIGSLCRRQAMAEAAATVRARARRRVSPRQIP